MKINALALVLASLGWTACITHSRQPGDHDAMMTNLTDAQRTTIDSARAVHDQRTDELAAARRAVVRAKAEHQLSVAELDLAEGRVKKAEAEVEIAETGSTTELEAARAELDQAVAELAPRREMLNWRTSDIALAERAEARAGCSQKLAGARVDLEKARGFSQSDSAASRRVDLDSYELKVEEALRRESHAQAEWEAAARASERAERNYDDALRASGLSRPGVAETL